MYIMYYDRPKKNLLKIMESKKDGIVRRRSRWFTPPGVSME